MFGDRVAAGPESQIERPFSVTQCSLVIDAIPVLSFAWCCSQPKVVHCNLAFSRKPMAALGVGHKAEITSITSFFSVYRLPSQLPFKESLQSPLVDLYLGVCNLGRAALVPGRSATCTNLLRYQYGSVSMSSGEKSRTKIDAVLLARTY